jgi:peptidoglycan-associated lipoprotein
LYLSNIIMKININYIYFFILLIALEACSSTAKIKDGKTAFEYKQYEKASSLLQKDFDKAKTTEKKITIAKDIVTSYNYTQEYEKALDWSKRIYALDSENQAEILLKAYKQNEKYQETLDFLKSHTQNYKSQSSTYKKEIETLEQIINNKKELENYNIKNLKEINSTASDYGTFIQNNIIYFTSTRNNQTIDHFTGDAFSQTFSASIVNDTTFNDIKKYEIKDFPYHFAQIVFNKDKTEAFFTQCGTDKKSINDYCKIYTSTFFNASWTAPEMLNFSNDTTDEAQAFLSPDGEELYFTSNAKNGYGGSDIYVSKRGKNGKFSQANNLGSRINTNANECFPTIYENNTLYFSSDKKNGIGALDVYKSTRDGNNFSIPENMQMPVNSGSDDFYYTPSSNKNNTFYISSNRLGTIGKDDIFYIEKIKIPEPEKPKPPVFAIQINVRENIYEIENNPNSKIIQTKAVEDANVFIPFPISNAIDKTDKNGIVEKYIFTQTDFKYKVYKDNYLIKEVSVELEKIKANDGDTIYIKQTVLLQKIYKNIEITLDNIYYDYNKAEIRADAKVNLDTLIQILSENPSIKIELASHTDCRGSNSYNETLSQKRAESVVNYLIEKGISKERLVAKGYGENALLEKCECTKCSEVQHQKNRRTTFRIID